MKCTLCDERRVAEPAYYCDRACQKRHWPEHKALHARLESVQQSLREHSSSDDQSTTYASSASSDQFDSLLRHAEQARIRGEQREAVKRAKKAIALEPDHADGYVFLADTYSGSGDFTSAVPQFLKAMELTDTGTAWNRQLGDKRWAKAASHAFACLLQCDDAPKPAWFNDTQQLKRMADRAVAALPDNYLTLQMRIEAYRRTPELDLSLDDLRQMLRDVRGVLASFKEGTPAHGQYSAVGAYVEAELRKRVAMDCLAALIK